MRDRPRHTKWVKVGSCGGRWDTPHYPKTHEHMMNRELCGTIKDVSLGRKGSTWSAWKDQGLEGQGKVRE